MMHDELSATGAILTERSKIALLKQNRYYTFLGPIFRALGNRQLDYNWLISDTVCYPSAKYNDLFSQSHVFLTGEELTSIINDEDFQLIWGACSGFPKDLSLNEILEYPIPLSESYNDLFRRPIHVQHPLAIIEINAFDSSADILISLDPSIIEAFRKAFPDAQDFEDYIQ